MIWPHIYVCIYIYIYIYMYVYIYIYIYIYIYTNPINTLHTHATPGYRLLWIDWANPAPNWISTRIGAGLESNFISTDFQHEPQLLTEFPREVRSEENARTVLVTWIFTIKQPTAPAKLPKVTAKVSHAKVRIREERLATLSIPRSRVSHRVYHSIIIMKLIILKQIMTMIIIMMITIPLIWSRI